jgi:hypothetical protein
MNLTKNVAEGSNKHVHGWRIPERHALTFEWWRLEGLVNLISIPDQSNNRSGVRYAPRSGAHSQVNGVWAPVAQRQNK